VAEQSDFKLTHVEIPALAVPEFALLAMFTSVGMDLSQGHPDDAQRMLANIVRFFQSEEGQPAWHGLRAKIRPLFAAVLMQNYGYTEEDLKRQAEEYDERHG
jgi:hypothetical protein